MARGPQYKPLLATGGNTEQTTRRNFENVCAILNRIQSKVDSHILNASQFGVTAAASIADNAVARGDGGVRGIQGSPAVMDDAGNLVTPGSIASGTLAQAGNFIISDGSNNTITLTAPPIAADWTLTLPIDNGVADEFLQTDGAGNTSWVSALIDAVARDEWLQNGFPNKADSTITFTDGTRTFSIQPVGANFNYYDDGVEYITTGDTVVITNVEGAHLIYYNGATLTDLANPTGAQVSEIFRTQTAVCWIYWDTTAVKGIYVGEERHGINMAPVTHAYLHFTEGLRYVPVGLGLNTLSVDQTGNVNAHAQFGADAGQVSDEDLFIDIAAVISTTGLPIYYLTGAAADWNRVILAGYSVLDDVTAGVGATGRLVYNQLTGGAWQLTTVTNNDLVLCHVFATTEKDTPLIAFMGQEEYGNLNQARAGAEIEVLSLITNNTLAPELRPIATVIFQTGNGYGNAVRARVRSTADGDDYIDWRSVTISRSAISTSDHSGLSNLPWSGAGHTIDVDLAPAGDNALDCGTAANSWRSGYFDTNVLIGTTLTLASGSITNAGASLLIQDDASQNVEFFASAAGAETPTLQISGFRNVDVQRTLSIGISSTANDTVNFTGLSYYVFDGNLNIPAGGELGCVGDFDLMTLAVSSLTVSGTLLCGGAAPALTIANGSITDSSGAISFGNENLSTTGRFGIGSGAVGAPGWYFAADTDCGAYYTATQINWAVSGSQRMQLTTTGLRIDDYFAVNAATVVGTGMKTQVIETSTGVNIYGWNNVVQWTPSGNSTKFLYGANHTVTKTGANDIRDMLPVNYVARLDGAGDIRNFRGMVSTFNIRAGASGAITGYVVGMEATFTNSGAHTPNVTGDATQLALRDYSSILGVVGGTSYGIKQEGSTLLNNFQGDMQLAGDDVYVDLGAAQDSGMADTGTYMLFDCDRQSATGRWFSFMNGSFGVGTISPDHLFEIESPDGANIADYIAHINNLDVTSGQCHGLRITAGNDSGDAAFYIRSRATSALFLVLGDGTVGIKTVAPGASLHVVGTDGIIVPIGTTGQRVATQGMIRLNTTSGKFEGYNGAGWVDFH